MMSSERSAARVLAITTLCSVSLLLLILLAGPGLLDVVTVSTPAVHRSPAVELGIGELEMGPDFGRPTVTPARGPVATALLYGVLLLCPAKFVLLWALQRRESSQMGVPASGDA